MIDLQFYDEGYWGEYSKYIKSVEIKDGVTSIGAGAFNKCVNITSVSIPASVTSIGQGAFYCCYELMYVKLPDGITEINDYTFRNVN